MGVAASGDSTDVRPTVALARGTIRVESAVNTIPTPEETVAKLQPLASGAAPLALEIAVNVTGARPAASSGQRDLFSEDTSTVLVFENGAVIRLAAAVVTGQLLFLTDKRSNGEVVCQVVRKRSFRPTECYVELEFTEPAPKFWGVDLPAKADAPVHKEVAQMVESAETAEADVAPVAPEASGQEVENLKHEVDGLREQIQALLQAKTEATKVESAREDAAKRAEVAAAEVTRISVPGAAPAQTTQTGNVPAAHAAAADGKVPEAGAGATPKTVASAPAPPMIRMALPKATLAKEGGAKDAAEIDPLDYLLPKPALDFSSAPRAGTARVSQSLYDIYKPVRAGIGKFPLAAISTLVLAIFLAGAWRMNWVRLPWLGSYSGHRGISQNAASADPGKSQSGVAHAVAPPTTPSAAPAAVPATNKPNAVAKRLAAEASSHSPAAAAEVPNEPGTAAAGPGFLGPATSAVPNVEKPVAPTTAPKRANATDSGTAAVSRRKSAPSATPSATAQPAPPEPAASDATLVPPKLLKSVPPVYPPEAMENYITGDVRVDAVVEPDGKIGAMKILTGPAPLRQAAMDALKQYEYAPATQGGKAVPAHVTATVKFWFNP
jgi:TonB family protein